MSEDWETEASGDEPRVEDALHDLIKSELKMPELPKPRVLFCRSCYGEAIVELSHRIVEDKAAGREKKRSILFAVFQCTDCSVLYGVAQLGVNKYYGFQCGEHDRSHPHKVHPLADHIKQAVGQGIGLKQSGKELLQFVRHEVGCDDLSRSTMQFHMNHLPENDWRNLAARIPAMTQRWREAGLKCQEFHDGAVLQGLALELPTARFCLSDAFIGVVFVDGCHVSDKQKSTLLSIVTVTSDHIILPVAILLCPAENKEGYTWLFEFTREMLPSTYVMMSDQSTAMIAAFSEFFDNRPELKVTRLPCFFHIMQKLQRVVSLEIRQILRADHPLLYQMVLSNFRENRKRTYDKIADSLHSLSYMSPEYKGVFEFIADSPVESFNHAICAGRSMEPLHLIQTVYSFCLEQFDKQNRRLGQADGQRSDFCLACVKEIEDRKSAAMILPVRQSQIRTQYIVSEQFPRGATLDYTVETVQNAMICSCHGYERMGIPCRHMYAVSRRFHNIQVPPIRDIHKTAVIRQGLGVELPNVSFSNLELTSGVVMRPPKKKPGRPRKGRLRPFRAYFLAGRRNVVCGACGQRGHTRRSRLCPARQRSRSVQPRVTVIRPPPLPPRASTLI